jgi:hypothetical protein
LHSLIIACICAYTAISTLLIKHALKGSNPRWNKVFPKIGKVLCGVSEIRLFQSGRLKKFPLPFQDSIFVLINHIEKHIAGLVKDEGQGIDSLRACI